MEQLNHTLKVLKKAIVDLRQQHQAISKTKEGLMQCKIDMKNDLKNAKERLVKLEQAIQQNKNQLQQEIERSKQKKKKPKLVKSRASVRSFAAIESQNSTLGEDVRQMRLSNHILQDQIRLNQNSHNQKQKKASFAQGSLQSQAVDLQNKIANIKQFNFEAKEEYKRLVKQNLVLAEQNAQIQQEKQELQKKLNRVSQEIDSLKEFFNLKKRQESFYSDAIQKHTEQAGEAAQSLMQKKKTLRLFQGVYQEFQVKRVVSMLKFTAFIVIRKEENFVLEIIQRGKKSACNVSLVEEAMKHPKKPGIFTIKLAGSKPKVFKSSQSEEIIELIRDLSSEENQKTHFQ